MVTAAFIGPGTVTVCTLAGVGHGYDLLWALLFSVLATMALQEMAARLGWVTQAGLGQAIRASADGWKRVLFFVIVISAIVIGNAAYEAGNIGGAVLGVEAISGSTILWPLAIGAVAFVALFIGRYRLIEKLMGALVLIMSICFVATAIVLRPDLGDLIGGFVPRMPSDDSLLTVVGLVGTTVVPYNLFLHASSVSEKWKADASLKDIRTETAFAIGVGGVISMAIVVVSAAALHGTGIEIRSASDMAIQLEPLMGRWARIMMGLGLFAAGISSAITAPLAAAYAARELFGWAPGLSRPGFRAVWMGILGVGVLFASVGIKPILVIRFAQIANGILLPVIAVFLVVLVNRDTVMGTHRNHLWHNVAGIAVVLITCVLSFKALNAVLGFM
jgi:NRAMP (natural resistance-associated macrophage protein)-like metal ion transporter